MNTNKIAQAVKNYLVDLAINDNLPMDINDISEYALEEVIKKALPSEHEQALERAMDFLCDNCDDEDNIVTTEEMVEMIANHPDQSDMIDNVEGVIVWEKVEYSFTCEQFLEQIGY